MRRLLYLLPLAPLCACPPYAGEYGCHTALDCPPGGFACVGSVCVSAGADGGSDAGGADAGAGDGGAGDGGNDAGLADAGCPETGGSVAFEEGGCAAMLCAAPFTPCVAGDRDAGFCTPIPLGDGGVANVCLPSGGSLHPYAPCSPPIDWPVDRRTICPEGSLCVSEGDGGASLCLPFCDLADGGLACPSGGVCSPLGADSGYPEIGACVLTAIPGGPSGCTMPAVPVPFGRLAVRSHTDAGDEIDLFDFSQSGLARISPQTNGDALELVGWNVGGRFVSYLDLPPGTGLSAGHLVSYDVMTGAQVSYQLPADCLATNVSCSQFSHGPATSFLYRACQGMDCAIEKWDPVSSSPPTIVATPPDGGILLSGAAELLVEDLPQTGELALAGGRLGVMSSAAVGFLDDGGVAFDWSAFASGPSSTGNPAWSPTGSCVLMVQVPNTTLNSPTPNLLLASPLDPTVLQRYLLPCGGACQPGNVLAAGWVNYGGAIAAIIAGPNGQNGLELENLQSGGVKELGTGSFDELSSWP